MRIKQIYITKEGEPMANPGMEYPKPLDFYDFEVDDGDFQKADDDYNEALEKYHSGLLPFEDREKIKEILRVEQIMDAFENGKLQKLIDGKFDKLKPDTLIPVELEVEVVEKYEPLTEAQYYGEANQNRDNPLIGTKRKVLRIKP